MKITQLLSIPVLLILTVIFLYGLAIVQEEYCMGYARSIVGKDWSILKEPTKQEYHQLKRIEQITWGYREQLRCERYISEGQRTGLLAFGVTNAAYYFVY